MMDRRAFLRRTAPVLAGGIFVPKFGRWFARLGRLWAPAPLEAVVAPGTMFTSSILSSAELSQVWRKVQGKLGAGFEYVADDWQLTKDWREHFDAMPELVRP